jgi:hypothetical protein
VLAVALGCSASPAGAGWSAPVTLARGEIGGPALDVAPSGRAVVAWSGDDGISSAFGQLAGPFEPAQIVADSFVEDLAVAIDGSGRTVLAWVDDVTVGDGDPTGDPVTESHVLAAQREAGLPFGAPRELASGPEGLVPAAAGFTRTHGQWLVVEGDAFGLEREPGTEGDMFARAPARGRLGRARSVPRASKFLAATPRGDLLFAELSRTFPSRTLGVRTVRQGRRATLSAPLLTTRCRGNADFPTCDLDDVHAGTNARGAVLAAWTYTGRRGRTPVRFAFRAPGQKSFGPPGQLARLRSPFVFDVSMNARGDAAVAIRSRGSLLIASRRAGGGFGSPERIGAFGGPPAIAMNDRGVLVVAWEAPGRRLVASIRPRGGRFSPPRVLGTRLDGEALLDIDDRGRVLAAWREGNEGFGRLRAAVYTP